MIILSLHVENFGKLQNFDLRPQAGLNVLYHKNGWGKSTLAVFIKAMLYGLPATSRRSLDENERKKYTPWQGGVYGGSLEFKTQKGSFRVERTFAQKESGDTFSLFDLATNKPSTAYSASLGEELFGIDADGFERSTYLSQRALNGGKDNNSISAKLGNLLDDVGDIGNYDTAIAALEKRRRFYTLTGNRGAIAEMESEGLAKKTELERCLRVKEALEAQESELAECTAQLQAVRKTAEETRVRIGKAGLARERAALLERKNKMLEELASLSVQKQENDAFFRGEIPTAEELAAYRELYERVKNASVRLDAIAESPADAETMARLRDRFPTGVPSDAELERIEHENETLREIRTRREYLQNAEDRDELSRRFATGAPSSAELESAHQALAKAESLQKTINAMAQKPNESVSSPLTPISSLFLLLGVALAVMSFLPILSAFSAYLFIFGVGSLAIGTILCIAAAHGRAKKRRWLDLQQKKRQECDQQRDEALHQVQTLLTAYRMPTENPARSLTELSVLADRYRETLQRRRRTRTELDQLKCRREDLIAGLNAYLAQFFGTRPLKEDYRADIEQLRRDASLYLRLESAERHLQAERAGAESNLQNLKNRLQPFLRRYDPAGKWRAGECLDRIGSALNENRRLTHEIVQKENELKAYIAEKKLDQAFDIGDAGEFDRLSAEERELQAREADLQHRHAALKSGIERLAQDVDRIPELEGELAQLKLRMDEAKANAATIVNTAKFLEEAKTALSTRYLDGMQESFRAFLSLLTDKDAPESVMDTSFDVRLREGGQSRTMESFSRGWRDTVAFCVRLSLTDALYAEGEKPFLLLDDPFVNLDDKRLAAARCLLDSLAEKYQILYLVCHQDRI